MMALLFAAALAAPTPVLVELFTSEGCSSCPSADEALQRISRELPFVIALEEHVDYWDYLGWRDPFSSARFSERQREYAPAFGRRIYTPQMVIDGAAELVGSDEDAARKLIDEAARTAKPELKLSRSGGSLRIEVPALAEDAELWLAFTEAGLQSKVERGENAARLLQHAPVARSLEKVTRVAAGKPAAVEAKAAGLRAVVFATSVKTRRVLAAAALSI